MARDDLVRIGVDNKFNRAMASLDFARDGRDNLFRIAFDKIFGARCGAQACCAAIVIQQ